MAVTGRAAPPPAEAPTPPADLARAALWMIGAVVSFSLMAVAGRELAGSLDTFEIMLWRSVIGLALVAAALTALGRWGEVTGERAGLHLLRNALHFTGQNLWFWAIAAAPLAQVFALEFTSPLWAALLAPLVLGERLTRRRLLVALAGFAGVLAVTRPGTGISPGLLAAALSAVFFALTNLMTRRLTRHVTLAAILLWLTATQTAFSILAAGADGQIAIPPAALWGWVLAVALAGLVAHVSLTSALALAPAAVVMPIDFARLPLIALVGALLYGEALDRWLVAGAAIIVGANWAGLRGERRRA